MTTQKEAAGRLSTGVDGLDEILNGGLLENRLYLIEGDPGSGKTTIGLQFVSEGARRGEDVLYVSLSETAEELHSVAASHGWSLDGVRVCELTPPESARLWALGSDCSSIIISGRRPPASVFSR